MEHPRVESFGLKLSRANERTREKTVGSDRRVLLGGVGIGSVDWFCLWDKPQTDFVGTRTQNQEHIGQVQQDVHID